MRTLHRIATLLTLALLVLLAAACQHRSASSPASGGDAGAGDTRISEAERTKQMETKAQELRDKAAEIQGNTTMTEQEKIDAVNKLEQERQDLDKAGDSSAPAQRP
jgi:TolA-binding protein